jgi:hypothetical protein
MVSQTVDQDVDVDFDVNNDDGMMAFLPLAQPPNNQSTIQASPDE